MLMELEVLEFGLAPSSLQLPPSSLQLNSSSLPSLEFDLPVASSAGRSSLLLSYLLPAKLGSNSVGDVAASSS